MHHAIHVLERNQDLRAAQDTFRHYWSPLNIESICDPVEIWQPKHTYGTLLTQGLETLARYHALKPYASEQLLALEYEFVVPVDGTVDRTTGEPHLLGGTIDRLALRKHRGKPIVAVDDYKTGRQPTYLRHHLQGTAYSYATTHEVFWTGWDTHHTDGFGKKDGRRLYRQTADFGRLFTWINLSSLKFVDGGYRGPRDYQRFRYAIQAVADAIQHNIYPLNIEGEVCQYCPYRDICGDVGLDDNEGIPA
jgi:hypothetical protein